MKLRTLLFVTVYMSITACTSAVAESSFREIVQKTGRAQLTGWLRLRGEIELYSDQASMRKNVRFPACISGVFADHVDRVKELETFDKQRVTIKGEIISYEKLPEEQGSILPRKLLAGTVIINSCFGDKVFLLERIEFAKQ